MQSTNFWFGCFGAIALALASSACSGTSNAAHDADAAGLDAASADAASPEASLTTDATGSPDAAPLRADRFVTKVVSFTPGDCAGFGATRMPEVVYGPPIGAGDSEGGTDVVSLGIGGEIVVSFEPNAIVDGPGVDLLVFENAFFAAGNPNNVAADPGEVSVSDDGVTWATFPCTATHAPYGSCAGWHPVYSSPTSGISPVDPSAAGGDPFDLKDVGLARARFVRVRDRSAASCPTTPPKPTTSGFDLDAMAIVNALSP